MISEIDEKTERLASVLNEKGLDGVLLNGQHNFAWITAGGSNGIDLSRENGAATVLVTKDQKRYVISNNIEGRRLAAEEVDPAYFEPIEFSWQNERSGLESALSAGRELAGERIASDIPLFPDTPAIEPALAQCRYRLTEPEIERSRELGRDASLAMEDVILATKPGETETEIANRLRYALGRQNMASVVTLVAADERIGRYRHPLPTGNRLEKVLLLVTCAKRHGLIVSLSRMVSFGRVSDDLKLRTEAAASVNAVLLDATRESVAGKAIYEAAKTAYTNAGFVGEIDLHHQGGAAGYKTREWVIHPESRDVVQNRQLFAYNPSITGTKVEDTVITGDSGIESITGSETFPRIETVVNGRSYFSAGVLSI